MHFRATTQKTLPFLQPCLGKTVLPDKYPSDVTLFHLYLGKIGLIHLLPELERHKEFLATSHSPFFPAESSQSLWNCYASSLKVPFQHFLHSRGLFQPALGILPTDLSATSTQILPLKNASPKSLYPSSGCLRELIIEINQPQQEPERFFYTLMGLTLHDSVFSPLGLASASKGEASAQF